MKSPIALVATVILSLAIEPVWALQPVAKVDDLAAGIRQVEEGDLEGAVITLDGAVRRLSGQQGKEKELATAHLYLAMTHLGLSQLERAKADMREAWRNDRQLALDPKRFPPRLIEIYEQTKQEAAAQAAAKPAPPPQTAVAKPTPASPPPAVAARPSPAPTPKPAAPVVASQPAPSKKGGGSKALWIGLGVAAVGGGVAAAAGGGGDGSSSSTSGGAASTSFTFSIVSSVPAPGSTVALTWPGDGNGNPQPVLTFDVTVPQGANVTSKQTWSLGLYSSAQGKTCLVTQAAYTATPTYTGNTARFVANHWVVQPGYGTTPDCGGTFTTNRVTFCMSDVEPGCSSVDVGWTFQR